MKSVFKEQIYRKYFQIMAKVSRIKMKNGKYYLFNGLTRVRSNFSYTLLICLFNPIVFLHCTFHFRLFFLFLFHSFHSYQSHYWYFLQTCSFLAFHSPRISYFLLFFPFSYSSFPLSTFIYIFFPSSSIASFDRTFLFLSPINLFPKFLLSISPYNEQSRCLLHPTITTTTTFHPIYSAENFPISDRGQKSIIHRKRVPHTSKSNLRSRFIEKRHRQRPRLSSHANSLLLVIY